MKGEYRKLSQQQFQQLATERFGEQIWGWQAQCPHCGDIATPGDFRAIGADAGKWAQECIGRSLPSDSGRGCDFAAYGLIPGPWEMVLPHEPGVPERIVRCFALADPTNEPEEKTA